MEEQRGNQNNYPMTDVNTRVRDSEERQRLLRDRIILIGQSIIDERSRRFSEMQEIKKTLFKLEEDTKRIKALLERVTEQLSETARKEELMILQRQFNLFRN